MFVLNIGLQGCSLARTAIDKKSEVTMRKCNGMDAIWRSTLDRMSAAKDARMNAAMMGGEEVNNISQEQPLVDIVNAATMGGGVDINIIT